MVLIGGELGRGRVGILFLGEVGRFESGEIE